MLSCQYLRIFLLPVLPLLCKTKFKEDKCDETATSQTTISVNVAFDRIRTVAASIARGTGQKDFACISRSRCHTRSRPTVCPFHCTRS